MSNMLATVVPKSDQLNADDLIGGPRTIRIAAVKVLMKGEQPVEISFDGDEGRPWKPCKSMRRVLIGLWGVDGNAYVGRSLTLYRDERVLWAGAEIGGIRISHASGIDHEQQFMLTATKSVRKPFKVRPLLVALGPDRRSLEAAATKAASDGVEAFRTWYKDITAEERAYLKPTIDRYQEIATHADAAKSDASAPGDDT